MLKHGLCLFTVIAILGVWESNQVSSQSKQKVGASSTAEQRLKLTAKFLGPPEETDSAALQSEFKEVEAKYPKLAAYFSKHEALTLYAAATATQSCSTFKDRFILTTAAQAYRRALCPDHVLTPAEGLSAFPTCFEKCEPKFRECLHFPFGSDAERACRTSLAACYAGCQ